MTVDNALRDALRGLAPEPPDDLGSVDDARRRGRAIRRRRRYAAASATALSLVAILGVTVVGGGNPPRPADVTSGDMLSGTFPDWPVRGDLADDDTVLDAAVSAFTRSLGAQGINRTSTIPLYAGGGGDRPVVVLHATPERGGERFVVVTREAGGYEVFADVPAPLPGEYQVSVLLGAPEQKHPHPEGTPCVSTPGYVAGTTQRLLVLGPPGELVSAGWRLVRTFPPGCGIANGGETAPQAIALTDGAGLADVRVGQYGTLEMEGVERDGSSWTGPPTIIERTVPARYPAFEVKEFAPATGLDWPLRTDQSRADAFAEAVRMRNSIQNEYGECVTHVARSLPDGTPVVLCVTRGEHPDPQVVIWAENAERRARSYARISLDKPGSPYSAIVDGHAGRWLVVIGAADENDVTLVDGADRRAVPMTHGMGYLRLESEPSADARLTTPDFAEGGGFAIADRTGEDREPRG